MFGINDNKAVVRLGLAYIRNYITCPCQLINSKYLPRDRVDC